MKYLAKLGLSLTLLLLSATTLADTAVGPMNYQGRLLDNAGIPLTGSYNFSVSVYNAATGGTLKYRELHNAVAVNDGVYSFLVGTQSKDAGDSTWSVELWNCCSSLYLEISVNGSTLSPRHRLAAAPFAFQSNLALTTNNALALGGKPATWFDSTLEAICASGKGKWLELANGGAGACLGAGSSYPGPAVVSWNTLSANPDFSHLDLTNADISGIDFSNSSLRASVFKNTTYRVAGLNAADLRDTQWDGAIASDATAYALSPATNLSGATLKNMAMNKWNLSDIGEWNYDMLSAAYLSSCPAGLPNIWQPWICKTMHTGGNQYFLFGPRANFSVTSAAAVTNFGVVTLDLDNDVFDDHFWGYASFVGVTLTQSFKNSSFYFSNLTNATIRNVNFSGTNFNGAVLKNSTLENVTFANDIGMGADYSNATLTNVVFNCNVTSTFNGAILKQVHFTDSLGQAEFANATLEDVTINYLYSNWPTTTFDNTRFFGRFHINNLQDTDAATNLIFKDMKFYGATVSGDFSNTAFGGTPVFSNVVFENIDLCATTIPHAPGPGPHSEFSSIIWRGSAECPDGTDIVPVGTCNSGTRMTPTAVGNCSQAPIVLF